MRFQIENSKSKNSVNEASGGRRYLPYVFTEHGIAMLAGVLRNDIIKNLGSVKTSEV